MGKVLKCRDVGVDCGFEVRGETEEEILAKAAEHAQSCHAGVEMTSEVQAKIKAAIKDESSA